MPCGWGLVGEPVLGILVALLSLFIVLWLVGRLPRGIHNHMRVYPESLVIPSWVLMKTQGISLDMCKGIRGFYSHILIAHKKMSF